ncbi:MAG: amidase, partial [Phycisphaeraceae bacterium]
DGLPTRAGSVLRERHRAVSDAPVVSRLREAGAIILGKTVTCEFACFDPSPTRNPWNPAHTAGGSSSGSAAAVAAQMCPAAIGSQTGGSMMRPAAYCGVAAIKPTFGRVPTAGVFPVSPHLDHIGTFARDARDLSLLYSALTKTQPPPSSAPWKLALLEEFFMDEAEESVRHATLLSLDRLEELTGSALSPANDKSRLRLPKGFGQVHEMHRRIMAVDAAAVHHDDYQRQPDAYGPNMKRLIEHGNATTREDYEAALNHQERFKAEVDRWFPAETILVTPTTNTTAPADLNTTGDPKFNTPWSYAGLPTVTIPGQRAANGMPCGLQFIGPRDADYALLGTVTGRR